MRRMPMLLLAALLAGPLLAADIAGVKLDDKVTVAGKDLVLNGAGLRTRAIFKVYVAGLYVPAKTGDVATVLGAPARRVQLNMLRTLSADQLVDALNDGLRENNSEAELGPIKAQVGELATIMRSFKEAHDKDVIVLDYADGATRVALNGEVKGTIQGDAFNKALLKVWLGEHPVQAELKRAMLGGA